MYISFSHTISQIIYNLFEAEKRRLQLRTENLIKANNEAYGEVLYGFIYLGKYFTTESQIINSSKIKDLHPTLYNDMIMFLEDSNKIQEDKRLIHQLLVKLFKYVNSNQDIRDVLPDCLLFTLGDYSKLNRTREPAYTVADDKPSMALYERLLPKIEEYAAVRLIY